MLLPTYHSEFHMTAVSTLRLQGVSESYLFTDDDGSHSCSMGQMPSWDVLGGTVRGLIPLTGLMGIPCLLLCLWASSCVGRWTFNHKTWHYKSVWSWFSLFCSQLRTMLCVLQVWLNRVKGTFLSSVFSYFNHLMLWGNLNLDRTRIKFFSLLNWNTSLAPQLCNLCSWNKWGSSPGGRKPDPLRASRDHLCPIKLLNRFFCKPNL